MTKVTARVCIHHYTSHRVLLFLGREALPRKWCAMCSRSAFRDNALGPEPRPSFTLLLFLQRFFSAHVPRSPYSHLCNRCARAVLSLYGYFYLFLRGENTQSDITDPETVCRSRRAKRGREREEHEKVRCAAENIYVHAVDKITANLHARWLAFAKPLPFPLNRRVLLLLAWSYSSREDHSRRKFAVSRIIWT